MGSAGGDAAGEAGDVVDGGGGSGGARWHHSRRRLWQWWLSSVFQQTWMRLAMQVRHTYRL